MPLLLGFLIKRFLFDWAGALTNSERVRLSFENRSTKTGKPNPPHFCWAPCCRVRRASHDISPTSAKMVLRKFYFIFEVDFFFFFWLSWKKEHSPHPSFSHFHLFVFPTKQLWSKHLGTRNRARFWNGWPRESLFGSNEMGFCVIDGSRVPSSYGECFRNDIV